jgi:hypothetical protein
LRRLVAAQVQTGRTEHFLDLCITAHGALHQLARQLVYKIRLAAEPTFKAVARRTL